MKICNETHNQIIDSVVNEEREKIQHGRIEFCDTLPETEQLSIVFFFVFFYRWQCMFVHISTEFRCFLNKFIHRQCQLVNLLEENYTHTQAIARVK